MTRDKLNQAAMIQIAMAVPPLAEQHRIAAKVDELMALCDQLEQQQTHSLEAHQTLVETLLGTLTSVESPQELTEAWARIANHFDTLFTTKQSIDQLKQTILQLAVMGKLVSQDPNDEPANVMLERIAQEKAQLVKEGKLGAQKPLPEVAKDEEPFGLPNGWMWTRLGGVTNYGITDKAEPEDVNEDTWVLDLEDVEKETSKLLTKNRFAEKPFRSSKNRFSSGDVIYGKLRPYLDKVLVADEEGVCTTEMVPVRGFGGIYPFYLRLVMKTPHFIEYADESTHGMNLPRLGTDKARMALFPLAPLAEQHRIVAKVDELMALCDVLKAHFADAQTIQNHLADAIVEQAFA
jgi:type I restriction enzyme S subunit